MKVSLVSIPAQDPVEAHAIYTKKLGFTSKEFDREAGLAVVVSAEDPKGGGIAAGTLSGNLCRGVRNLPPKLCVPAARRSHE